MGGTVIKNPYAYKGHWKLNVVLFFAMWTFMSADRMILTPVQGVLAQLYDLSYTQLGLLNGIFLVAYTALQLPAGLWADRFGRVFFLWVGLVASGLLTIATGWTTSFASLLLLRALVGLSQSILYPPQFALATQSIPARYRSTSFAVINLGQAVGIGLGLTGASYLAFDLQGGWQMPFYVFGFLTVVLGFVIWFGVPDNASTQAKKRHGRGFYTQIKNPVLLRLCGIGFASIWVFFMFLTWLPIYLKESYHVSAAQASFWASVMIWAAIPGSLVVSWLSDQGGKHVALLVALLLGAALTLVIFMVAPTWPWVIGALLGYGAIGKMSVDPLLLTLFAKHLPTHEATSSFGIFNFVAMSAASISPLVSGWLVDVTGSWSYAFGVGVFWLLAASFWSLGLSVQKNSP